MSSNILLALVSFVFFTALVGLLTWWKSRGEDRSTNSGFFLAGRSLTFPFIAASLLLTNLS
ncbi:MAG: solute:sodium symporter family transporter, partial [Kiritimatiellia bacterium]